jgi:hypothetical protein
MFAFFWAAPDLEAVAEEVEEEDVFVVVVVDFVVGFESLLDFWVFCVVCFLSPITADLFEFIFSFGS